MYIDVMLFEKAKNQDVLSSKRFRRALKNLFEKDDFINIYYQN